LCDDKEGKATHQFEETMVKEGEETLRYLNLFYVDGRELRSRTRNRLAEGEKGQEATLRIRESAARLPTSFAASGKRGQKRKRKKRMRRKREIEKGKVHERKNQSRLRSAEY